MKFSSVVRARLAVALIAGSWLVNPSAYPSPQTKPVNVHSWWSGDGNANDSVGGNNGILEGGTTFAPGKVGMAFEFNGTDADVRIPASTTLNVGAGSGMTLAAWINPSNTSAQPLIEWNDNKGDLGAHFWISVYGGSGSLFANLVDTSGGFHIFYSGPGIITAGTFQHVAMTYDQSTGNAVLYANGDAVATTNLGVFTPQTSYDLYFADRPSGLAPIVRFAGAIDEIHLFSRALSAQEIRDIAGSKFIKLTPTKIGIRTDKPSALVGQPVYLLVFPQNNSGLAVAADRDYHVLMKATGEAQVFPPELTLNKGERSATAEVRASTPGREWVQASSTEGLQPAHTQTAHCAAGPVQDLVLGALRDQAKADNTDEIEFSVDLVDDHGTPTSDGNQKVLGIHPRGVGRVSGAHLVPANECSSKQHIISGDPGTATVSIDLIGTGKSHEQSFHFILPLTYIVVLLVLLGGVGGAFVQAAKNWHRCQRWRYHRWLASLASGALAGLCVFLAYYYGLLKALPQLTGGLGLGFLMGLVGGFLGPVAFDRVADRLLPPSPQQKED